MDVSEHDLDGVHVLAASGELDLAAAAQFCARIDEVRDAGHPRLLLDLTELEFCDSSGLRALIGAAREVLASGGQVVMVPPVDGPVARLFALAGAPELLPLQSSEADGVAALS
jgi:anti-sigma B factor antagonist